MGLGATVRCDCFEKGLMKPCPVDPKDIYVDEDGYLSSRSIDSAYREMGYERFVAQYGELQNELNEWAESGCIHEDGELCSEQVGNWAACAQFQSLVDDVGGQEIFPLLASLLPSVNGGVYPSEKAAETLRELERFIEKVCDINEWVLCDVETEEEIWSSTENASFVWMYGTKCKIGMNGPMVFFIQDGKPTIETSHFKQVPFGTPDAHGHQPMKIICLDNGCITYSFDSIGPKDCPKTEREFHVTSKTATFLYEGKYLMTERIRNLLLASIQTGNPIRWC